MVARSRITISLENAECRTLVVPLRRFDVSSAWLGHCTPSDLIQKYNRTEAQFPTVFPKERRGGSDK